MKINIYKISMCILHTIHIIAIYYSGIFFLLLGLAILHDIFVESIVFIIAGSIIIACATDILFHRINKIKVKQIINQ
jgi:hypothetical protein